MMSVLKRSQLIVPATSASLIILPLSLVGILVFGLVIFRLQSAGMVLPLLSLTACCLGILVVIRPEIGLAALVVSAAIIRITIGTGTGSVIVASLVAAVVLVAGWIAHRLINRQRLNLLPRGIAITAVMLMVTTLFAFLWGRLTLDPRITIPDTFYRVQIAQATLTIVAVGLLFVGADLFRKRMSRDVFTFALISIGFIALPLRWSSEHLRFLNTDGLFGLWFVSFCWANALANRVLPIYLRFLLGVGAIGWLLTAFVRDGSWVSGWLPGLIALLTITVVLRPQLGMGSIALALILGAIYFSTVYDILITTQESEGSLGGNFGRLALIERNIDFFQTRLLVGMGPAGYALYYVTFLPDQAMSTHNNYVDILAETGIIGLVSLISLLGLLFVYGRRSFRTIDNSRDRAAALAVVGALPALGFSLLLGDWLIPFVYNQTIAGFDHAVYAWLSLAMLCGIIAQQSRADPQRT